MQFLDFPAEVVENILIEAVLARSIKRALALRLVCNRFSQEVRSILFKRELLDDQTNFIKLTDDHTNFITREVKIQLQWKKHRGSEFWHSYFVYRVLNTTWPPKIDKKTQIDEKPQIDRKTHAASQMRRVADLICEETDADLKTTIEALCWPAMYEKFDFRPGILLFDTNPYNPDLDLLCAAAYLNLVPMVKRLLQVDNFYHGSHGLFPSPMLLAAYAGNKTIIELFQNYFQIRLPKLEVPDFDVARNYSWKETRRFMAGPELIIGAAIGGHMQLLRSDVHPIDGTESENTDSSSQVVSSSTRYRNRAIDTAQCKTPSVEVCKYLGCLSGSENPAAMGLMGYPVGFFALGTHARLGDIEMVRFFLDSGTDICGRPESIPLSEACKVAQEEIVDLLLERGADPDFPATLPAEKSKAWFDGEPPVFETAVSLAAKAGSLSIVRKLIGHGADLNHPANASPTLRNAVRNEDTQMVKLLLELGVDLGHWGQPIICCARQEGLDSMVELLESEYFKLPVIKRAQWAMVANGTISLDKAAQGYSEHDVIVPRCPRAHERNGGPVILPF